MDFNNQASWEPRSGDQANSISPRRPMGRHTTPSRAELGVLTVRQELSPAVGAGLVMFGLSGASPGTGVNFVFVYDTDRVQPEMIPKFAVNPLPSRAVS